MELTNETIFIKKTKAHTLCINSGQTVLKSRKHAYTNEKFFPKWQKYTVQRKAE
jgi:hypothetical protein